VRSRPDGIDPGNREEGDRPSHDHDGPDRRLLDTSAQRQLGVSRRVTCRTRRSRRTSPRSSRPRATSTTTAPRTRGWASRWWCSSSTAPAGSEASPVCAGVQARSAGVREIHQSAAGSAAWAWRSSPRPRSAHRPPGARQGVGEVLACGGEI
jgi:hypothetical protein